MKLGFDCFFALIVPNQIECYSDLIWIVNQVYYGNLVHKAQKFTNDLGLL